MIRVALVDDQQLIRAGFRMVIDSQPDMEVVAEAGDGAAAIATLAALDPPADVALVDVRMPGVDGIAACEALTATSPTRVIILTTFDLDEYVVAAIRVGASGFLLKDAPPEDLLAAVRTVHAGDAVIAPSSTKRLLARVAALPDRREAAEEDERLSALTDREREVLTLMARGLSNQEIRAELFLAEPTVKTHVGRVLAKLGARDRVQAVVIAYEAGLVRPHH
ncbi:transcriptional regulatory protein DegU [Demequina sediminis]|uniref:Transcriptional regulatory protein DegU n=1 Tax=Demequina sediminis TaxID=1930058 RepID=A0ABP9WJB1_9MICO|nr:response regulator transcription factor [Demequina sediminis]BDZ62171.1 DNA-binding response regulator [Demequina sediminis]